MNLEFLGHGGWLVDSLGDCLLIDPLLNRRFGRSAVHAFVKTAHAEVSTQARRNVRAVVLTTDHFQRCDWASLASLAVNCRVFVSEHFAEPMRRFLAQLALEVVVCRCGETVTHGRFEFVFVPGDADTLAWDSRVCSLMLNEGDVDGPVQRDTSGRSAAASWCFFQSDTRIHRSAGEYRPHHWPLRPAVVVLSCHYREHAQHGFSPWDSLLHERRLFDGAASSLDFARHVFPVDTAPLNIARQYLLCGGDYERLGFRLPVPLRDKADLCEMVAPMLVNASCAVATVGRRYGCLDRANGSLAEGSEPARHSRACRDAGSRYWPSQRGVSPAEGFDQARSSAAAPSISSSSLDMSDTSDMSDSEAAMASPFDVVSHAHPFSAWQDAQIGQALAHLATVLLLSDCGKRLLFTNEHLGRPLGPRRMALKLLNGDVADRYEFCFAHAAFMPSALADDELLELPAGLVVDKSALLDVWQGTVSAVEAFSYNAVQWYEGSVAESPLGMVYLGFAPFAWSPAEALAPTATVAAPGWQEAGRVMPGEARGETPCAMPTQRPMDGPGEHRSPDPAARGVRA
ncbi:MAG: hypothetical protein JWQ11_1694 [Rhizobacter sp.]|nr:hypothetical protein [Rhizobacter sp.]